jgi:hypothetical protein
MLSTVLKKWINMDSLSFEVLPLFSGVQPKMEKTEEKKRGGKK